MSHFVNLNNQPLTLGDDTKVPPAMTGALRFADPMGPQVEEVLVRVGVAAIRAATEINLPVQAHAALEAAARIYGIIAVLPVVPILDPNNGFKPCGRLDMWAQRQSARKERRGETEGKPSEKAVVLVNFGHPIADQVMAEIAADRSVEADDIEVRTVRVHLDVKADMSSQFAELVDAAGVSDWERVNVVVNPPAMGLAALGILSEIHGRRGTFPPVLGIREPVRGEGFHLVEVANLNAAVDAGRTLAGTFDAGDAPISVPREMFERALNALVQYEVQDGVRQFDDLEGGIVGELRALLG